MRRTLMVGLVASLLGVSAPARPATTVTGPKAGGFMSANVEWVGYLPLESPAVSGRVVKVGEQTRFYVSNFKGITIYDVTDPAAPRELGRFALPHSQNEDVEVSDDGTRTIVSADGGFLVPLFLGPGIHVLDTSDPANIKKVGFHPDPNHTSTCADPQCNYLYGSEGDTYDLRDPTNPVKLAQGWQDFIVSTASATRVILSQGAHDMARDATGLISTDTVPRVILDPRPNPDLPQFGPAKPRVLTTGTVPGSKNLAYQHNSARPNAAEWVPRDPLAADYADPAMRPGEMLIANGETNLEPRCDGSSNGPIATWSMANFDRKQKMTVLEVFRPKVNGTYADGNPAANVLGCSGHYFDYRDEVLAAAWFEHGTRFITVDPATGKMAEVGYFQPVVGSAGAAYWIDDEYVYVTDYERGVDILKFDRTMPPAPAEELEASWMRKLDAASAPSPLTERERYFCKLARDS